MSPVDLFAARTQMAVSLGFHIVFACVGMVMPFFMAAAHWKWLKTRDRTYYELTRAWSKGVAVLFATGAVSGTVLSFELGLLWPRFMEIAGPVIGLPFALEGTAFFLEAIAIGFYLYGWGRADERVHWASGVLIGLTGVTSGIFVVSANSWMNTPAGFELAGGLPVRIDPWAAFFNAAWPQQAVHMVLAAFVSTGFAVAGIHAILFLKGRLPDLHRKAIGIAFSFAACAALLQPLSGDWSAKVVARTQPAKLAAFEGHQETMRRAPVKIGPVEIPGLLSFLAHGSFDAEVKGLRDFPESERPPVPPVRGAFQLMVAIGFFLAAVSAGGLFLLRKRPAAFFGRPFLRVLAFSFPLGFLALQAGWVVTEVGRQPWIIQGILKTREALTPMPGLLAPCLVVAALYLLLSVLVTLIMLRQFRLLEKKEGVR